MSDSRIYADYNSTAPIIPEAKAAMVEALEQVGNPSSAHSFGRAARKIIEDARAHVAKMVGALPAQVIFTSGGTEANNMASRGFPDRRLLASAIEHSSALLCTPEGAETIPSKPNGVVNVAALEQILGSNAPDTIVSVMAVNNETGVIQPIAEIAEFVHSRGALLHTDAVQAVGRIDVDMGRLGVDMLSLSSHKIGGPQGVGALVVREGLDIKPLLVGGGQERRRRSGTENVAGIAGFGAAAALADWKAYQTKLSPLQKLLEDTILSAVPTAIIHGRDAPRVANTTCISMPGILAEKQLIAFDLAGIAISAGSACSSGKTTPSHTLSAMGVEDDTARCAIRISLCPGAAKEEILRIAEIWLKICRQHPHPLANGAVCARTRLRRGGLVCSEQASSPAKAGEEKPRCK